MLFSHGVIFLLEISPNLEHSISYQYQGVAIIAGLLLMNSLACRVFRLLRQLRTDDGQITRFRDIVSTLRFQRDASMRELAD